MTNVLLDAGPLVALFDPLSDAHEHYHQLLATTTHAMRLNTTWPCITEAAHFLSAPRRWAMLDWVAKGGVMVFPIDAENLLEMLPVMEQYTEPPRTDMNLADASLVWVAVQTKIRRVLTIDVRDFFRYRLPDGSRFDIL